MLLIRHSHCPEGDSTALTVGAVYGDERARRGLLTPQRRADLAESGNQRLVGECTRTRAGVRLRRAIDAIGRSKLMVWPLSHARPCAAGFKVYPVGSTAYHIASFSRFAAVGWALVARWPQFPHKRAAFKSTSVTKGAFGFEDAAVEIAPIAVDDARTVHSAGNNNCICHD